jgi:iron complex outermembrane recepter protein
MALADTGSRSARCVSVTTPILRTFLSGVSLSFALLVPPIPATGQQTPDLADQSLEDLMNIQVISVSKKEQSLSRTASATFVITEEDIRRSGATSIPDLLRIVPSIDVAQINANTWAISARGLNERFSNELLVLIDGRKVYTPTTGGVFWDVFDLPLEDIKQIEVILGPGGSVWGANAVNGVINIITKTASQTSGALAAGGGGNQQEFGTLQYGARLGKNTDYRLFAKYFNDDPLSQPVTNLDGEDGWHLLRAGFRTDTKASNKDSLTFEGDIYSGRESLTLGLLPSLSSSSQTIADRVNLTGGFFQTVWHQVQSARSDTTLQASFDRYERDDVVGEDRNTFNIEFQQHLAAASRHDVVWGLNYSYSSSTTQPSFPVSLHPPDAVMQLVGVFGQDEIALVRRRLSMTLGGRLDHNPYTGFSLSPSVRLAWTPDERQTAWIAVSDAARTPAETDVALRVNLAEVPGPGGMPALISLFGNPKFNDETLTAFESGYRRLLSTRLSIDLAAFYNDYRHQQTTEPEAPFIESSPAPTHLVFPMTYRNLMRGEAHGFEAFGNAKITSRWTLSPGYAFERFHMHPYPSSKDTSTAPEVEGSTPHHSAQLRSHVNLLGRTNWDTSAYFISRLSALEVPSYTRLDTQVSREIGESLQLSLVGQNLLTHRHLEFVDTTRSANSTEMQRCGYARLVWRF